MRKRQYLRRRVVGSRRHADENSRLIGMFEIDDDERPPPLQAIAFCGDKT